jgi:propionyl-CoA synthetase
MSAAEVTTMLGDVGDALRYLHGRAPPVVHRDIKPGNILPDVAECAVFGVADAIKGEVPLGFVVLKQGVDRPDGDIVKEAVEIVRDRVGPVAAFKTAKVVARLPKTRSGKILRSTMRCIANGEPYKMPATIDDPTILDEITVALEGMQKTTLE